MKKVLVFLSLMVLPVSVMAMSAVSDSDLSDVTGQAGVSINANVTMDMSITCVAWGDSDGLGGDTTGGWMGIKNLNLTNMTISSQEGLTGFQPITIDIASDPALYDGATFVRYGLGTLRITMPGQTVDVALGDDHGVNGAGLDQMLGQSYMNLTAIEFNPTSKIDVWAGNIANGAGTGGTGVGVNQTVDISIKELALDTVSWGDTDGLDGAGAGTGGFIGIRNLVLTTDNNPITVTGTMSINTGAKTLGGASHTVVHIEYTQSNFIVDVPGPITGQQVLSSAKELTGDEILGDIYISSLKNTIHEGSYVEIYAH